LPVQMYPIPAVTAEAIYKNDELFLRFTLRNGKMFNFPI